MLAILIAGAYVDAPAAARPAVVLWRNRNCCSRPKPTAARAPDASPATRRPTSRPCTRPARCAWAAPIATEETPTCASPRASQPVRRNTNKRSAGASAAARSGLADRSANPERAYTAVAEGKPRIRALRQSRRSARRAGNVRQRRLPHLGSAQRLDQHDDHRRNALGRGALQQRRLSPQGHAIRRKLRARRHAADRAHDSSADAGRDAQEGHPARR